MTVPVQTVFNSYISAGTSTFVYGFQILSASHLVVTLNGVTKTQGVDYAVTGVGVQAGGTITGLATVAGDAVILKRVVPLQRLTDYQNNGDLLAGTLNPDLDLIWQTLQQIDEKANRALALPIGISASATLPAPVAGTFLGWDSLGAAIQNYAGAASVAVSTFMAAVVAATTAAAARLLLGVAPRATRIDVASVAGTVDLTTNAPNTDDIRITGALAITGFTVATDRVLRVTAGGAFTLTNGAGLVTQTGANIVAAAGDTFMLRATAANVVEVLHYVVAAGVPNLSITGAKIAAATITPDKLSGAQSGSAPGYVCRAWCMFDGSLAGTNAPRYGGNVTNVTKNAAGDYTINFATALPSANYIMTPCTVSNVFSSSTFALIKSATQLGAPSNQTASACQIMTVNYSSGNTDNMTYIGVAFFG
jgi:hypothetical protein